MAFKNIRAQLDEKGILHVDSLPSINHGENISVGVEVTVAQEFLANQPQDVSFHVEYKSADNKRYVTPAIELVEGKLICEVKNSVLCCAGEAQLQVVAIQNDGEYIFKSQIATFFVGESINAVRQQVFSKDFLSEANEIMREISGFKQGLVDTEKRLADLIAAVQAKLDNGEFVGEQGIRGDKGEKGDKGDTPVMSIIDGDLYATYG